MIPNINIQPELRSGVDALYVTRPQKERFTTTDKTPKNDYPVVNKKLLKERKFKKTLIMHPLPRVDELAYELDADPRSMYFKQAAWGVPIRMALISLLLGESEVEITKRKGVPLFQDRKYPIYKRGFGVNCPNSRCVSTQTSERKYLQSEFKIVDRNPLTLRCIYCEHGFEPEYIASSDWHEGKLTEKKYHSANSHWARQIKPDNLIIFDSEDEAQAYGFKPSSYVPHTREIASNNTPNDNE
jgi:hypothetical protein